MFFEQLEWIKQELESAHIPLNQVGVGFQSHVYERGDRINPEELRSHMRQIADLGFITQVSENDVYSDDGSAAQARQYADVVNACFSEPSCVAYRAWILSDRYNVWMDEGVIRYGVDGLFDTAMQPRPAFYAIQKALHNS